MKEVINLFRFIKYLKKFHLKKISTLIYQNVNLKQHKCRKQRSINLTCFLSRFNVKIF